MEWWVLVEFIVLMIINSYLVENKINKLQARIDELEKRFRVGF